MTEPLTKKIDTLPVMTAVAASNDKLLMLDVSESAVDMTKLVPMNLLSIHTSSQLAANVVENAQIKNGAVTSAKIGAGAVIAGKIATGGVSAAVQLADGIVTNTKLGDGSVTSGKLGNGAVTAGKIAIGGVSASSQIAGGIVTNSQLAAGAALANLGTGTVDTVKIADGAITQAKLGAINRTVAIPVFGLEDNIIVKNFSRIWAWPPYVNNHVIIGASAVVLGAVSTSGTIGITLINQGGTLATISIAAGQWSANSGSINSSLRTALSFATFSVNVTASGSGAKGLTIYLQIQG